MLTWNSFFQKGVSASNHQKGHDFELLTANVLRFHPLYASLVETVWLLREGVPSNLKKKLNLPSTDEGIDIVAQTYSGEYWAIQCKFKASKEPPTMKELSTFNNLAHTHCKHISLALLFHTGERGVRKKHLMGDKYAEVGLEFWMGLSQEEWNEITLDRKKRNTPVSRKPREHQKKAIKSAQDHFIKGNASRGRLIMPCGTGKSLTAFWIANSLKAKSVVVAVPSLNLIKQSLQDWTAEFIAQNEHPRPEWQVICSDESTSKIEDDFVSDVYSLGIPTTTNVEDIKAFLKRKSVGRKIIFTTYQSSERLAQAAKALKYTFDLAILDEAHKTVGIKSKSFASLLSDDNIMIQKRMFMTATERVLKGTNDDVLSMDDETVYGKRFYQLTFKEAIHSTPQIISDYKILTIAVTNSQIQELIQQNKLISDGKNKIEEDEAQSLAAAIALRQATQQYGIKHAISFHRSIKAAENFTNLNIRLNSSKVDKVDLSSYHISSKKSAGQRSQLLDDFKNNKLALMTNAKCLTEGVNVPAIDCVLFADPKQSVVDIVQAAGRALRVNEGKQYGYIMMPLIVPDDTPLEEFTETTAFKQVARIVTALSTQDERIVEEFRMKDEGKKVSDRRIEISGSIPVGLQLDFNSFASSIEAKYWEKIGRINWRNFIEAKSFVQSLNLKNRNEWEIYYKAGLKPKDIPSNPNTIYSSMEWKGWGDWLGTGNIANFNKVYREFTEARELARSLKFKNGSEWVRFSKSGLKPDDIPAYPAQTYKDSGWNGMSDWLGNGNISNKGRSYKNFNEAKAFIHSMKLKNNIEWRKFSKSELRPKDIPGKPDRIYKNDGWKGWGDWLGSGNIANYNKIYRSFNDARDYARSLNLKTYNEWNNFSKSGIKPDDIPTSPVQTYKNDGWKGWGDWLGTGNVASSLKVYRSFTEAREIVRALNFKSGTEWRSFCKSGLNPDDIPAYPNKTYKNSGWISMGDWLGSGNIASRSRVYKSFIEARKYARSLDLNSISDWRIFSKTGKKPADIPGKPDVIYKSTGWKGYVDWLGIDKMKKYKTFLDAREFVRPLNLKGQSDWKKFSKSGRRPIDIPSKPSEIYLYDGWKGWGDWLGTGNVSSRLKQWKEFNSAREFARSLELKNVNEWRKYCKSNEKPNNIPSQPHKSYFGKGWISYGDWLGTGIIAQSMRKFRSLDDAKKYAQSLNMKSQNQWKLYCKKGFKPDDIPAYPNQTYKNSGWKGWDDFLGQK